MTEEQHNLCYEIQFALVKAICNMDHEKLWELIKEAIESERKREKDEER